MLFIIDKRKTITISTLQTLPQDAFSGVFGTTRGTDRPSLSFTWVSGRGNTFKLTMTDEGEVVLSHPDDPSKTIWNFTLNELCSRLCAPIYEARFMPSQGGLYIVDGQDLLDLRVWAWKIAKEQLEADTIPFGEQKAVRGYVTMMNEHHDELVAALACVNDAEAELAKAKQAARQVSIALKHCMSDPSKAEADISFKNISPGSEI